MRDEDLLIGSLLEDACLTLEELCSACALSQDWVERRVREGLLPMAGETPEAWRFSSRDLRRARVIWRYERDFEAEPELAALVADLMEEIEALRARLRRAGVA
jgi:chaperone modulatory protein CbpM